MAISFEQPSPVAADILFGAGRSDARQRNAQLALQNQGQLLQAQNDFFRTAIASGAQRADAGRDAALLENRRFEFLENQAHESMMQSSRLQAQAAREQERNQLDAWRAQLPISYAEEQRLVQLQSSLSNWDKQLSSGKITDEEYYEGLASINAGMTPLQVKQQQAEIQGHQARMKAAQELAAQRSAEVATAAKFEKSTFADRIIPLPPELGGGKMIQTKPGQWDYIPPEKTKPEAFDQRAANILAQVEADEAVPPGIDPSTGDDNTGKNKVYKSRVLKRMLDEFQQKQSGQPTGAMSAAPEGSAHAALGGVGAAAAPKQPLPTGLTDLQPFKKGDAPPTPQQAMQVANIKGLQDHINRLSPQQKAQMQPILDMLEGIVHDGIQSDERETYDRLLSTLARMPSPGAKDSKGKSLRKLGDLTYVDPNS